MRRVEWLLPFLAVGCSPASAPGARGIVRQAPESRPAPTERPPVRAVEPPPEPAIAPPPVAPRSTLAPTDSDWLFDDFESGELASGSARQSGRLAPASWWPVAGVWFAAPPNPDAATVADGALSFRANGAVLLDVPLLVRDELEIAAFVDPIVGDTASADWVSIVLAESPSTSGWVSSPDVAASLLVRSNGAPQAFRRGSERPVAWGGPAPTPAHGYDVVVRLAKRIDAEGAATLRLDATIGDAAFTVDLERGEAAKLPKELWLCIGAHFAAVGQRSVVSAIRIRG